ncbi:MAG: hypothetical protein PF961_03035 [Planctomycetota bacterium]|jgi:hypothetical protein|nr:hypothetical protein [Planctomycetota bacterium]
MAIIMGTHNEARLQRTGPETRHHLVNTDRRHSKYAAQTPLVQDFHCLAPHATGNHMGGTLVGKPARKCTRHMLRRCTRSTLFVVAINGDKYKLASMAKMGINTTIGNRDSNTVSHRFPFKRMRFSIHG